MSIIKLTRKQNKSDRGEMAKGEKETLKKIEREMKTKKLWEARESRLKEGGGCVMGAM